MYEAPKRLPEPLDLAPPSALPLYVLSFSSACVLALVLLGLAQFGYVFFVYNVGLGLVLGGALALGIRLGRYPVSVGRMAWAASTLIYLLFDVGLYLQSISGVSGSYPSFFAFMAYRAAEQSVVFGLRPGTWMNLSLWIGEIGLTTYVALRLANRALAQVRLHSVPTEVTEFVLYLLFQGKGAGQIESELAARGWTERRDVVRALDAADIAASLIRASQRSKSEAPTQP